VSVCVSVCLSAAACPHYCMYPDITWRTGRGCPLVVHYWADLQSVHGLRCYGNITQTLVTYKLASTPRYDDIMRTRNVSECSVLALYLVQLVSPHWRSHPLSSSRHHLSYDDCREYKRENYQNCSVLCCVRQLCTVIRTHT